MILLICRFSKMHADLLTPLERDATKTASQNKIGSSKKRKYIYVATRCPIIIARTLNLSYYSGSGNNYGTPCKYCEPFKIKFFIF